VYVKASIEDGMLIFQIYNNSLDMKETFPDGELGKIKLKFSDGTIKSERVGFLKNAIAAPKGKDILYNYLLNNKNTVKVHIDLATANEFYSDSYNFKIQQKNLKYVLNN